MLAAMLKSFLPDDFDMEKSIVQAQQFMADVRVIAEGVKLNTEILQRIESKLDSDPVAFREHFATLPALEGERNERHSGATCIGDGATGNDLSS